MKIIKTEYHFPENLFRAAFHYFDKKNGYKSCSGFEYYFEYDNSVRLRQMYYIFEHCGLTELESAIVRAYFSDNENFHTYKGITNLINVKESMVGRYVRRAYEKIYRLSLREYRDTDGTWGMRFNDEYLSPNENSGVIINEMLNDIESHVKVIY